MNPGDTGGGQGGGVVGARSLNEGRGVNPGDTRRRPISEDTRPQPLNEGRGVNPGDTPRRGGDTVQRLRYNRKLWIGGVKQVAYPSTGTMEHPG